MLARRVRKGEHAPQGYEGETWHAGLGGETCLTGLGRGKDALGGFVS